LPSDIEETLLSRKVYDEFVRPSYQDYCLSSVPSTILRLFGIDNGRPRIPPAALRIEGEAGKLVLFVADGLGYYPAKANFNDRGFFGAAASSEALVPITSIFPSTTAAALTTVCTGLTPQEHCLPEWFVYIRELEQVIATLPFSAVGDSGRDRLVGRMNPRSLFLGPTINWALKRAGVDVVSFVRSSLARTVYSRLSHRGSEVVSFITASDLMASLRKRIEEAKRRTFFYVYWESVDTIGHVYAPSSEASGSEVSLLSYVLKKELIERLSSEAAKETALILTADHGQISVDPDQAFYLNPMRQLMRWLERTASGRRIPPWGSARDVYLAVKEEKLDKALLFLRRELGARAVVLRTQDALGMGLFGLNKPKPKFLERIGNLMILPRDDNLIWYKFARGDALDIRGHHGGLAPGEMLIPLVAANISALK